MDFARVLRVAACGVVSPLVLAIALPLAAFGQADPELGTLEFSQAKSPSDPLIGTWKVNFAKSEGEPWQRSITMTFEKSGDGRKWTIYVVSADGTSSTRVSAANDDGKEYPVTGSPGSDAIVLKRIDANTWEEILKKAGKPTFVGRWVLSGDGKVLTIASSVRKYVRVYEKQ